MKKKKPQAQGTPRAKSAATHENNEFRGNGKARFEITVSSKSGGILGKRLSLAKDGKLIKDGSECKMVRGYAERAQFADVHAFSDLIGSLKPFQAPVLGVIRDGFDGEVDVVTKAKLNGQANTIARTKDDIVFRRSGERWHCSTMTAKAHQRRSKSGFAKKGFGRCCAACCQRSKAPDT